jgi:hypothetical protein
VANKWHDLEFPILSATGADAIEWLSPLAEDEFAEYRDGAFLERIGLTRLSADLKGFWPARGPQWDALGRTDRGDLLLVEAKAHVAEICTPATHASAASRRLINQSLTEAAIAMRAASDRVPWTDRFYQLGNRFAHLHWMRQKSQPAWLVLVNFINDQEMSGPSNAEAWEAAYDVAYHVMGLSRRNPLSKYVVHTFPDVRQHDG